MTILVLIVTAIYMIVNLAIGLFHLKSSDFESFISSKNVFNSTPILLSLTGTVVGGGMFFAVGQMGYEAGIAVLVLPFSYLLGYVVVSISIPKIRNVLKECNGNTLYDIVEYKLGNTFRLTKVYLQLLGFVNFGMYFFMLASQFSILASFYISMFNFSKVMAWTLTLAVIGGVTLIYSVIGGVKKDIMTDVLQVIVVFFGITIVLAFLITKPISVFLNVPSNHFNFMGYGILFPIGVILFFSPAFISRFDFWQRIIASKSDKSAKKALWGSIPLILIAYITFCFLGIYSRANSIGINSSSATIWGLENLLPKQLYIIVILALYSAVMASSDTLLNISSISLFKLIKTSFIKHKKENKNDFLMIRKLSVLVAVAASLVILTAADFVDLIIGGFSSLVILTPSIVLILFAKKPSRLISVLSLVLGYLVFLIAFLLFPAYRKYAFIIGFIISLIPFIFIKLINSKKI